MVDTPEDRAPSTPPPGRSARAQPELPFGGRPVVPPRFGVPEDADASLHVIHLVATAASVLAPHVRVDAAQELVRAPETRDAFLLRIQPAVEALVFAADHPMQVRDIVTALHESDEPAADTDGVEVVLQRLALKYSGPRSGVQLQQVAGGWALRTSAETARYLRRGEAGKPFRMGRAALETLAIIAYRQPVTRAQVDELRGVDSTGALKSLLDKNLVRVLGKAEEVGRPMLYGTTKVFLEAFNLRVLSDLPTLREYQELTQENQARVDALGTQQALGRIRDLAQPGARMVTEEAEQESAGAMADLERAMGEASNRARTAEVVIKAGGKLPPGMDLERVARPAAESEAAEDAAEEAPAPPPADDDAGDKPTDDD